MQGNYRRRVRVAFTISASLNRSKRSSNRRSASTKHENVVNNVFRNVVSEFLVNHHSLHLNYDTIIDDVHHDNHDGDNGDVRDDNIHH